MKWLPLLTIFCAQFLQTNAQNDTTGQQFIKKHCGETRIHIAQSLITSKEKLPPFFSNFEVIDFRQDTSRLGFFITSNYRREFLFKEPVSSTLATFFNGYVRPGGTKPFLITIKKLWLYDTVVSTGTSAFTERGGRIEFRGEVFLKTEQGYQPYTYLDTVVASPNSVKDMAIYRLPDLLFDFLEKIILTDEDKALKRNLFFTIDELKALNNKKYNYPMDTATVLQPGVYASIEEFRNNRPSITNYEIQPDENGLGQLYLKDESNQSYFSRKMFGYCDGKQCYVMMDGNLFPILSVGHAFYIYGSREYKKKTTKVPLIFLMPAGGMLYASTTDVAEKVSRRMHLFSLDPYSGRIY